MSFNVLNKFLRKERIKIDECVVLSFYFMKILIKPAANCVIKLYACHQHRRTEICMQFSDIQYNYDI